MGKHLNVFLMDVLYNEPCMAWGSWGGSQWSPGYRWYKGKHILDS